MSIDDKVHFLELLLSQTSKELKKFLYNDDFYLQEDIFPIYLLKTSCINFGCLDDKGIVLDLCISCSGNTFLKDSVHKIHYVDALLNSWKKSTIKQKQYSIANALCSIVDAMEKETLNGKSIVAKFFTCLPNPGIILWHAYVPIEQMMIELEMRSDR